MESAMTSASENFRANDDIDFLRLAATRMRLPGALVLGQRVVADEGFSLEEDRERGVILLKDNNGGGTTTISCTCALEGGGCTPVIVNPGEIDEYAVCVTDSGCGSSGLFCFIDFDFGGGLKIQVRM
jgi:hypothetical protein